MDTTTVNHIPRQFSGLGDHLARVRLTGRRHLSLVTSTPRFQTESQLNVPLHHPRSVEVLEILY